jgi:hypothetical protein
VGNEREKTLREIHRLAGGLAGPASPLPPPALPHRVENESSLGCRRFDVYALRRYRSTRCSWSF